MTLTEFLLARLAEDEAHARGAQPERQPHARHLADPVGWFDPRCPTCTAVAWPPRMLAEVAAKRAIVAALEDERQRKDIYNRDYPLGLLTTPGDMRARLSANARWAGLEAAVRHLASVYADHAEFCDEWRP